MWTRFHFPAFRLSLTDGCLLEAKYFGRWLGVLLLVLGLQLPGLFVAPWQKAASAQTVVLEFYDDETKEPISARFQWAPKSRKATKPRKMLSQGNWWLATPDFLLSPRAGDFEFLAQRGPEFTNIRGGFTIERNATDVVEVEIPRSTYMRVEKWYSVDHSVQIPEDQAAQWQRADAVDLISLPHSLALAPGKSAAESSSRGSSSEDSSDEGTTDETLEAAEDSDAAGTPSSRDTTSKRSPANKQATASKKTPVYEKLVESKDPNIVGEQLRAYHETYNEQHGRFRIHTVVADLTKASEPEDAPKSFSEGMRALEQTQNRKDSWIEIVDPWARDVPILLSTERVNAVQLLSHVSRPSADESMTVRSSQDAVKFPFAKIQSSLTSGKTSRMVFAPFSSKDRILFKGPQSAGRLAEMVYWTILETGLRLTPTAGSEFGLADTYLGYNRSYFYNPVPPTPQNWVDAIRNGEVVTTNGPLLRPILNGHPPGATHRGNSQDGVELTFDVSLTVREHVDYLDVVFNGETLYSAKLEDHYRNGEFPPLKIDRSGWLVTRVVTLHDKGYRLATSAPFYFLIDSSPRISKRAVEFMLAWLDNSEADIRAKGQWSDYEPWVVEARTFWTNRLAQANTP